MKILIVHPGGNISDNPSLRSILTTFFHNSYDVVVWRRGHWSKDKAYYGADFVEDPWIWWIIKGFILNKLCIQYFSFLVSCLERLRWKNRSFDIVVSVDRQGVIEANMLDLSSSKHIHLSYEIFFESETSHRFKKLERICYENVDVLVIQDYKRAKNFQEENNVRLQHFFLPVAGSKFVDKLITDDKVDPYILATGSLSEWTMISDLIDQAGKTDFPLPIMLHGRYQTLPSNISKQALSSTKILISNTYFSNEEEYYLFVSKAHIGYAMYRSIPGNKYLGRNVADLGLSSGKLSTFLACGVPVITNITGEFADLIMEYQAGVIINDLSQIKDAVACIIQDRDFFSRGAVRLFKEKLSFSLHKKAFLRMLKAQSQS